jgi:hypothetical protein
MNKNILISIILVILILLIYYDILQLKLAIGLVSILALDTIMSSKRNNSNIYGSNEIEKCIEFPFQRTITKEWPRMKYTRRKGEFKPALHWGQRKLHLSEVEFLTLHGDKAKTILYAGSADGKHTRYLSEKLFPNHKFILYDPAKFDKDLVAYADKNPDRVEIHTGSEGFFNDEVAKKYAGQDILFVSDIRSVPELSGRNFLDAMMSIENELQSKNLKSDEYNKLKKDKQDLENAFDNEVIKNMEWQQSWCDIIKPKAFMLKFRLPYYAGKTKYLDGDLYFQLWAGETSSETRLIGTNLDRKEYDNNDYEDACFYLNKCSRADQNYKADLNCPIIVNEKPLNNYDWYGELQIHKEYIKKFNDKRTVEDMVVELDNALGIPLKDKYKFTKSLEKNKTTKYDE